MRVLIIEDEVALNKVLAAAFIEFDYQFDVVETLQDGAFYLGSRNYDLVLMNSILSDGNGIELISEIKFDSPKTVVINQIRQKLDRPLNIITIETIRRKGYRFCYQKEG